MTGVALEQDQRFTRPETMDWIRWITRVDRFDVDPAACRESHWADTWYSARQNGLKLPWRSPARIGNSTVFVNPPFSDIEPWIKRAWDAIAWECTLIAMLIPASRTEQLWWQELVEPWRDRGPRRICHPSSDKSVTLRSHFPPGGRTRFGHPGNPLGFGVGSPPFTCVLLVWERNPQTSAASLRRFST